MINPLKEGISIGVGIVGVHPAQPQPPQPQPPPHHPPPEVGGTIPLHVTLQ
ncbi:MAG: hypothetical protein WCJ39_09025 [bacterium]